jgi:hypothetical protein
MAVVQMTALRDFTRKGKPVAAGTVFAVTGIEAVVLQKRGHATRSRLVPARPVEAKNLQAEASAEPPARRRRQYRRRDLVPAERTDLQAED